MTASSRDNQESHADMSRQGLSGRSRRQQAFMLFDMGMRPADAAPMVGLGKATAFRYFQQWKKLPPLFEVKYKLARWCFRKLDRNERRIIAHALANELGTTEVDISAQLGKPWAMRQIVTGEWRQWSVKSSAARRRTVFGKGVQILLSLRHSREVRHILKMAIDQSITSFENNHLANHRGRR